MEISHGLLQKKDHDAFIPKSFMFTKIVKKFSDIDLYTHHWNIPQTLIVKLFFSDVE